MRSSTGARCRAVAVAVLGCGLALSGCGVASTGSGVSDGQIELWTHNAGNPAELGVVQKIVSDFNASHSTKIKIQALPQGSYNDAVNAAAMAKKLPCLLDTDAPTVPNWAYANYLAPLRLPKALVAKQLPTTLGHFKGRLYSIGYYDAALGMFARKSALRDAGVRIPTLDHPWSGAEFNQALRKIKAAGRFDYALDLGTGDPTTEWWTYAYSPFLQSFGGDLVNRDGYRSADGVLDGKAAIAWGNWFQGLVKKGYTPAKSGTDAFADFVNGRSAMVWSGIWNATNLSKLGKDGVILPPPDFGNGPKIGGGSWQWAISSSCTQKSAALEYLEFSLKPKYLAQFAIKQNVIPATEQAAALAPGWQKNGPKRFFLDESRKYALIRPPTPGYPYITTTFAKAAQDIIAGADPRHTLERATADIDLNLKTNDYYGF